jgi:HEAT repeat protein
MKKIIFNILIFLLMPVAIVVMAIIHRPPTFEGKLIADWFDEMKIEQPSSASTAFQKIGSAATSSSASPENLGLTAFQRMGSAAVPVLQTELKSDDVSHRLKAAWALGRLGPVASNAIPDLILCLDDSVNNLPIFAIQALETIAPAQVNAIPKLLSKLSDPNLGVSNCAADLLNKIELARKANNISMPVSEYEYANAFLRASSQRVRIMGLQKLMQISPQDERVVATFKTLLNDMNDLIRQQAAMFLKNQTG